MKQTAWGAWTEDDLSGLHLRGADYLTDRVKIDCGPPLFRLTHADVFYTNKEEPKILHVAQRDDAFVKKMRARRDPKFEKIDPSTHVPKCRNCDPLPSWYKHSLNPIIVINIVFPVKNIHMSLVQYYERRVPPADVLREMTKDGKDPCCNLMKQIDINRVEAFDILLEEFLEGDDEFRDSTLKVIPRVSEGGYFVKKVVGRVPAILGKKVKQNYLTDDEKSYIEIDAGLFSILFLFPFVISCISCISN